MTGPVSPDEARFIAARSRDGLYESWYVRLVAPDRPLAIWIRHTIEKAPGEPATGTVWFTLFDGEESRPVARRHTEQKASVPAGAWVAIGNSWIGPSELKGGCHEADWELEFTPLAPPLFHLSRPRLYKLPLPKTKPISPVPYGLFDGEVRLGDRTINVDRWAGMVGHNWGSEHAERWIWLHGSSFEEEPEAWVDVAMGRIRVAGKLLPWVANGAIRAGGVTQRVGGLLAKGVRVEERPRRLSALLPVSQGGSLELEILSPENLTVGWRYGDPVRGEAAGHEVANCSAAAMTARLESSGSITALSTSHGAVYELGMTESDHGVPLSTGLP